MLHKSFLTGDKIYLRAAEPADAALFAACNNDPQVRHTFFTHTPTSVHNQKLKLEGLYAAGSDYIPFVIVRTDTDEAIGTAALHRVDLVSRAAVFGICVAAPDCWGMGIGTEATHLMLHYAFEILNLHRLQLHVWVGNKRGFAAYQRAGFKLEGTLREAMKHHNEWCDFHVMGILEDEWRSLNAKPKA